MESGQLHPDRFEFVVDPRRLYVGGFASESIVYEWGQDHIVEIMCNHHRYDDVDLEPVTAFMCGKSTPVIAICQGLRVVSGSFFDLIVECRRTFAYMAPSGLQYSGVFIESAVRDYVAWLTRLGEFEDSPIFTCQSRGPGQRHPRPQTVRRVLPRSLRALPQRRGSHRGRGRHTMP